MESERRIRRTVKQAGPQPTDFCARPNCGFPRSDHKVETEKRHTHFRTAPGDETPHLFATTCHEPYCHVVLSSCMGFIEPGKVPVSSFAAWYIREQEPWKTSQ
jgi:hypothetical protein